MATPFHLTSPSSDLTDFNKDWVNILGLDGMLELFALFLPVIFTYCSELLLRIFIIRWFFEALESLDPVGVCFLFDIEFDHWSIVALEIIQWLCLGTLLWIRSTFESYFGFGFLLLLRGGHWCLFLVYWLDCMSSVVQMTSRLEWNLGSIYALLFLCLFLNNYFCLRVYPCLNKVIKISWYCYFWVEGNC